MIDCLLKKQITTPDQYLLSLDDGYQAMAADEADAVKVHLALPR